MKKTRPPYLRKALIAFILTTIIFTSGFFVSFLVSYSNYKNLATNQEDLRYELLSFEVEKSLLDQTCDTFDPFIFTEEIDAMGANLQIIEDRMGKDNYRVRNQKSIYFLLETKHLLYILEHNNFCEEPLDIIIFFYSNKEENLKYAEKVGVMLSSLKKSNPRVMVYTFDYDSNSRIVELLKQKYNVQEANSLNVNEKRVLVDIEDLNEIKECLIF